MEQPEILELLIERHQGELLRYAAFLLKDRDLAQDAVQQGFLVLYRHPGQWSENVRAYLFRVVRNHCFNQLRRRKLFDRFRSRREEPGTAPAADAAITGEDDRAQLLRALETLPENWREIVLLRYREELSYQEISRIVGISVNHVGNTLHRALASLRKELGGSHE